MPSYKPWSFNPVNLVSDLTIFYGADLAMSLSLARCYNSQLVEKTAELLQEDLFDEGGKNIAKLIVDNPDKIIAWHKRGLLQKKTILICTSKNLKETEPLIDYVRCESLNSKTREWFVKWHCKRLSLEVSKNIAWIKNLDDLLFAAILERHTLSYAVSLENEFLWSEMRLNRFRYKGDEGAIWEHFELWIKENGIKEEYVWFFIQQIKEEIRLHQKV